jgi:hypothetical protein
MKKIFVFTLFLSALLLSACQYSDRAIQTAIAGTQQAWTPVPSQTPYPTYTPVLIVVTVTLPPTPLHTPTPTLSPIFWDKDDGLYLINVDIASGVWRSTGSGESCYWEITAKTGDIISNYFGTAGGTVTIPADGYQIRFENCGKWVFLNP